MWRSAAALKYGRSQWNRLSAIDLAHHTERDSSMADGLERALVVMLLVCCHSMALHAQADWPVEFVDDSDLHSVCFVDHQTGWAVGDRGLIVATQDGGATWRRQMCPTTARLNSVTFLDKQRGWIAAASVEPYSKAGRGTIVKTEDGGVSWQPLKRASLPWLNDVARSGEQQALAVGSRWPLFPSGVFRTDDNGRGWHPVPIDTEQDWVECDIDARGRHLLVGRHAMVGGFMKGQPQRGSRLDDFPFELRCGCWLDNGSALVAGDEGSLLALVNNRWLDAGSSLPPTTKKLFNFHAIATEGDQVWLAGSPGHFIWHSKDGGRSWAAEPTGQTAPIHQLSFVDDQHGWAVGAMGTILATRDGGTTWQCQRNKNRRVGALVIAADGRAAAPWMVLAHLSAEHRVRSRVIAIGDEEQDSYSVDECDRLAAAAVSVGASGSEMWSEFPIAPAAVNPNRHAIEAGWVVHQREAKLSPQSTDRLIHKLQLAIRQWRPELIVVATDERSRWGQLLVEATIAAQQFAEQTSGGEFELPPWKVKRVVVASAPTEDDSKPVLSPTRVSLPLGQSIGGLADVATTIMDENGLPADSVRLSAALGPAVRPNLGIRLANVAEVCRGAPSLELGHPVEQVTRHVQEQENVRAMLRRARNREDLVRTSQPIAQLPADVASRLMLVVAERQAAFGDQRASRQTLVAIQQNYSQQPAAVEALRRLFQRACSEEVAVRAATGHSALPLPTQAPDLDRPTIQASHSSSSIRSSSAADWFAQMPAEQRDRPEWQFALASTKPASQTVSLFKRLKGAAPTNAWRLSAAAELWLQDRKRASPKPTWNCDTVMRPHLDGILDEPIWSGDRCQRLGSLQPLDHPLSTKVWITRDHQYLYIAVQCQRLSELDYPEPTREGRPRDAGESKLDRIDLFFDVDRDYSTGWRLGFDSRGWAIDSVSGDAGWNPTWHVAASLDERNWIVEAAIPLSELVLEPNRLNQAWSVYVRRIVPGWGWQSWPEEASADLRWQDAGLLLMVSRTEPFGR